MMTSGLRGGDLIIGGGPGDDDLTASAGSVSVTVNGVLPGGFEPTGSIIAYGLGGDDEIEVAPEIALPTELSGGDGNDVIQGGSGEDVLVGGRGADRLVGNADDDVMIAGYTAFDYDYQHRIDGLLRGVHEAAVSSILKEWTFVRDYYSEWTPEWDLSTRIRNLANHPDRTDDRQNGEYYLIVFSSDQPESEVTVFDDGDLDVLTGSSGMDWFFFNPDEEEDGDRATDLKDEAFAADVDWILTP